MKITVERAYLANALGTASRAVSHRNTLPILSNILIETEDDRIKLTSTDLDTAIIVVIPAQVSESGAVAIPAGVLTDIVSKLPDAPITLEMQDGKVKVRCGKSDYMILSLPAEDFPVTPIVSEDGPGVVAFELAQGTLKNMLKMTTFAASKEETRSVLMGVLFEAKSNGNGGSNLALVATDTHRLALKRTPLSAELAAPMSVIVPSKPLIELERLLKDSADTLTKIRSNGTQVQFETNDVTLISRVLDGQYPNYEKVIPKAKERVITFDRVALLEAVRRVYIVAKQNSEKMVCTVKGDLMEITAESQDVGRAYEEVPVSSEGGNLTIAFNARYMIDVLTLIPQPRLCFELAGALNPGKITVENGDGSWLQVVMPMAV